MTKFNTLKKISFTLILLLAFVLGQNAFLFSFLTNQGSDTIATTPVSALSTDGYKNNETGLLSDSQFNNASDSSYPLSTSYWTLDSKDSNIKTGIIDLTPGTMSSYNYTSCGLDSTKLPAQPGGSEQKVLMINAGESRVSKGYSSKNGIQLSAGSFYKISINVWTDSNAFASIYLYNNDAPTSDMSFTPIDTNRQWTNYTFWVATSEIVAPKLNLDLYLGTKAFGVSSTAIESTGMVLFDNVTITRYSENLFNTDKRANTLNKIITLNNDITNILPPISTEIVPGYVTNDFALWDNTNIGDAFMNNIADINNYSGNYGEVLGVTPGDNFRTATNSNGIVFSATSGASFIKSPDIFLDRNTIYRFSFWAKGEISSGNLMAKIEIDDQTSTTDEPNLKSATFTTLSATNDNYTNGWNQYSFYVTSHPLSGTKANITLGIGDASSNATGYVFFTNLTTQTITNEQLQKASSIGEAKSVETAPTGDAKFTNGYFNLVDSDNDVTTLDTPRNWTHQEADATDITMYGVINIDDAYYNQYNIGNNIKQPVSDNRHNVLFMRNDNPTYQSYYSASSETLNSLSNTTADNGYYTISIDIQTQNLGNSNSGAYVYLYDNNNNIITWFRAVSDKEWTTYTVYIKTYYISTTITPHLQLGNANQPTTGAVFYDNCELTTITKAIYDEATINNNTTFAVDLSTDKFDIQPSTDGSIGVPNLWKGTINETSLDKSEANRAGTINVQDLNSIGIPFSTDEDDNNLLFIRSNADSYCYFESTLPHKLTANNYYVFSVKVRTIGLSQHIDNNNGDPFGASIVITGYQDAEFFGIDTTPVDKEGKKVTYNNILDAYNDQNNKFVEYTMYLCPTEDLDFDIQLGLGYLDALTSGYVFFDDISLTNITEDEYKNLTSQYKSEEEYPAHIISLVNASTTDDEPETYSPNFDWLGIPTVIIAIAVVVAVVGFMIKRLNEKRKQTVTVSTNYDRVDTLLKDVDRRNELSAINLKLRNLEDELMISEKFLREEIAANEKEIAEYNTAQEIASDTGIKIESPINHQEREQTIEQLELNIAQIKNDIEILKMEKIKLKQEEQNDINRARSNVTIKKRK
ncbi:MAG: hypothetical protein IKC79_00340 [Clostridia bacterium]|nr:hypothetical protein [Clostridia bacterium]